MDILKFALTEDLSNEKNETLPIVRNYYVNMEYNAVIVEEVATMVINREGKLGLFVQEKFL